MVRFDIQTRGFDDIARRMARASPKAEVAVATQILRDTEKFVPARNLSMANRTQSQHENLYVRAKEETKRELAAGRGIVVYPGPYAHFLYMGKLFIDPKTGSPFARKGASKVITGRDLNISKAVHSQAQSHWYEASKALNRDKWVRVAGRAVKRYF